MAVPGQVVVAVMALSLKSGKEHIHQCFQQHQSVPGCGGASPAPHQGRTGRDEGDSPARIPPALPTAKQVSEEHILESVCSVWSNSSLRILFSLPALKRGGIQCEATKAILRRKHRLSAVPSPAIQRGEAVHGYPLRPAPLGAQQPLWLKLCWGWLPLMPACLQLTGAFTFWGGVGVARSC